MYGVAGRWIQYPPPPRFTLKFTSKFDFPLRGAVFLSLRPQVPKGGFSLVKPIAWYQITRKKLSFGRHRVLQQHF